MPADGGTRVRDGELEIGPVQFVSKTKVLLVWLNDKNIINYIRGNQYQYEIWGVGIARADRLLQRDARRKFLRIIESGKYYAIIWAPGNYLGISSYDGYTVGDLVADGMGVADAVGTASIVLGRTGDVFWDNLHDKLITNNVKFCSAVTHLCQYKWHSKTHIKIYAVRSQIKPISLQCRANDNETCDATHRPRVRDIPTPCLSGHVNRVLPRLPRDFAAALATICVPTDCQRGGLASATSWQD